MAKDKFTLGLELPTDPRWKDIAQTNIRDILIDHAYCEQKAASSCISLIIQYPEREKLVDMLTPVVKEEWEHFERVVHELRKRGYVLGQQRKDEYVEALAKFVKKGGSREQHLVEIRDRIQPPAVCPRSGGCPRAQVCRILARIVECAHESAFLSNAEVRDKKWKRDADAGERGKADTDPIFARAP